MFNKPPLDELFALKHAEFLERGLYYSRTEFFEYLNSQSDARADQFYGSRFQGVYVNSHHACLVYLAVKKQIRLDSPIESRAIYEVRRRFCAITEVPEPEAIVFMPSVAMMYNMAINGKHGHDAHDEKTNLKSYVFLNNTCELFDHIYVFPRTFEYEESLQEFCGRTHEERKQFTVDLFKSLSQFELYSYAGDEEFMGYNVQVGVNNGYIAYSYISSDANDMRTLQPFLEEYKQMYGEYPDSVVADAGYGSYENYSYCLSKGIKGILKYSGQEKKKEKVNEKNMFKLAHMERTKDGTPICPAGYSFDIEKVKITYKGTYPMVTIDYKNNHCEGCPFRNKCTKAKDGRTAKTVPMSENMHNRIDEYVKTEAFRPKVPLRT